MVLSYMNISVNNNMEEQGRWYQPALDMPLASD